MIDVNQPRDSDERRLGGLFLIRREVKRRQQRECGAQVFTASVCRELERTAFGNTLEAIGQFQFTSARNVLDLP